MREPNRRSPKNNSNSEERYSRFDKVNEDTPIESLLNLGPQIGQWLREARITTIAELERLGPVVAYRLEWHRARLSLPVIKEVARQLHSGPLRIQF